ncbi:DNA oxidative demethylase AlkB [Pseudomonas sp. v388]|uniref:DNA oxidative demethylase AlkB n=1 Tax=Pseudomonas sp. v388 TaxID=2479849 RepID=UPI000F7AB37B|nr:DNA oxidative demethylase AlkB [Pseudomonas sp. v388]RRV10773.1 DNA oxidative demethylase AlkB [Pseudomonas sp. v388]
MQPQDPIHATFDLFADHEPSLPTSERIGPASTLLRGFALAQAPSLWRALQAVLAQAPFRQMQTPGGHLMSAAMSSCGELGWVTDRRGYRYSHTDPVTGRHWPSMPDACLEIACAAATAAGFAEFLPDACLINRYVPGAKMSLHQDRDEQDLGAPVVSVSLGIAAIFQFGGTQRGDPVQRIPLFHGDVVVWGGEDRLRFHGISPVKPAIHPLLGEQRINLTFRKAG